MTTGWLKTLDGADVYTDDGEWYWRARTQDWVHDPALLVMPAAPMSTKIQREIDRLSTGWPSLRSAVFPRKGEEIRSPFWRFVAGVLRGGLLYVWVWQGIVRGQLIGFFQFVVGTLYSFVEAFFHIGDRGDTVPGWLTAPDNNTALWGVLFMAITPSIMAIWFLYVLRVGDVDPHKGNLLAAATVATTGYSIYRRHQRISEQAFRDEIRNLGHG